MSENVLIRVRWAWLGEAYVPSGHKLTHSADWLLLLPMRGSSNPAVPPQVPARQLKMRLKRRLHLNMLYVPSASLVDQAFRIEMTRQGGAEHSIQSQLLLFVSVTTVL
jgi:hypothetical protein